MINRLVTFLIVLLTFISVGNSADQYFHVAAHNPGFNDTMWLTDAQVFNPDAVNSIEVSLSFLASGEDNTGANEVTITVGPRQAALLEDLVASVLDRAEAGSIRLTSDALFFASSRTFNIGDGESGTYGQYIGAASSDTAMLQGILLLANNDPEDEGFRTNTGFVNPGTENVSIEVSIFNTDLGVLIGSTSLDLPPLGFQQLNNVFQIVGQQGSTWSNATIQFLATAPVLAYASVVDNTSGDAIFVTPRADTGTPPNPNNPPAGTIDEPSANVTIAPGESVSFAGSASDPDGDDVTVLWDFDDGMTSTELEPGDHTFADPGEYVVSLTATDDKGLADPTPATRTITVQGANNPPAGTIDEPTANLTIAPGESVFFSGSTSDPDGDEVTVLWDFGDGSTSPVLVPATHAYPNAGVYTVTLTATDIHGLADPTPATRTVTVEAANSPPNGSIDQPSGNVTIAAGESVLFSGSASDPDGDPVTVLWAFGDGMTSTNLNPGNHTYSDAGTFTVTLTATDDHGLADPTPPTRTITVTAAAPTLTQIQDQIFSPSCDSCHGGGSPSADLNLEQGQSYSDLVNVPATTQSGTRVIPLNPNNSVLVTELEDGHRNLSGTQIQLIRDWITSGASDN
jgi:PKD repeat protein